MHGVLRINAAVCRKQMNAGIVQAAVARPILNALQVPDCSQGASTSGG
jgi:hypothetical protein